MPSVIETEYASWRARNGLEPHNPKSYVDSLIERSFVGGHASGTSFALRKMNEAADTLPAQKPREAVQNASR